MWYSTTNGGVVSISILILWMRMQAQRDDIKGVTVIKQGGGAVLWAEGSDLKGLILCPL